MKVIELKRLNHRYEQQEIFQQVSLEIYCGELVSLMGRSGAGKSTLLNFLGLLERPKEGQYIFNQKMIDYQNHKELAQLRRDQIGFIFQNYGLIEEKSVASNIELPLLCQKINKKDRSQRVLELAEKLNITDLLSKMPKKLSGGEAQRVSIARALIKEPKIILADEPTGSLDEETEGEILTLFKELNQKGMTFVIATHNPEIAQMCQRSYRIENKQVVEIKKDLVLKD